ncbi:hypothetical protein PPL_11845 [Heterostelium album PN500]|uniref:Uncharacterized protein n=1 Tax=Heterostelium pallidum (strain ATCC 26659 / Pp 5 / PN500) TaxID=670386 RepID=D3BUM4_HETP5|nr:hypothetical protein PPL_11845 [Heterostelium album PN500]EFA74812.1 hypothetical protein PPL_11845 [Heterostelium album PN500]|eukprot:XP_020426946.1 hypothetical protein PPL_11845 [Heterostelium album PN500]
MSEVQKDKSTKASSKRNKKDVSHITVTSDELDLERLTKDQLYQMCQDNMISAVKSWKKDKIIQSIVNSLKNNSNNNSNNNNDQLNQFERGTVDYYLPVIAIKEIFRICWALCLQSSDHKLRFKQALQLTLVNKQFHGIVCRWFTHIKQIDKQSLESAIDNPMNPIKSVESIVFFDGALTQFSKEMTPKQSKICSSIKKLVAHASCETNPPPIKRAFKNTLTMMNGLQSIHLHYMKLTSAELLPLATMKTLEKIEITEQRELTRDDLKQFYGAIDHPLKKLITGEMYISDLAESLNPKYHHSLTYIGDLVGGEYYPGFHGPVEPDCPAKPLEFSNLRKLRARYYFKQQPSFFKLFDIDTLAITHLKVHFTSDWVPVISKLRCLEILEDLVIHKKLGAPDGTAADHRRTSNGLAITQIQQFIDLPTFCTLIIYFYPDKKDIFIKGIEQFLGFEFSHDTVRANEQSHPSFVIVFKRSFFQKKIK